MNKIGGAIGDEVRLLPDKSSSAQAPGPGSYKKPDTLSRLGGAMGSASRLIYQPSKTPGPGQYKTFTGFGYTAK
jgi:hypothetical protein